MCLGCQLGLLLAAMPGLAPMTLADGGNVQVGPACLRGRLIPETSADSTFRASRFHQSLSIDDPRLLALGCSADFVTPLSFRV